MIARFTEQDGSQVVIYAPKPTLWQRLKGAQTIKVYREPAQVIEQPVVDECLFIDSQPRSSAGVFASLDKIPASEYVAYLRGSDKVPTNIKVPYREKTPLTDKIDPLIKDLKSVVKELEYAHVALQQEKD